MGKLFDHIYIAATIIFTTYSQVVMRWQVGTAGVLPDNTFGKAQFVARLLLNPWVLSGITATFLAGVFWMLALKKFELSYAYPFTGIIYVLVLLCGVFFFGDTLTVKKLLATLAIVGGLILLASQ